MLIFMRDDVLAAPNTPVTLEITPPALARPSVLLRRARLLGERFMRVNVIERPERWSSLEASTALREHGFDPVWHLANRGRGIVEIERDIVRAARGGLGRVLCIRGEHKADDHSDTPTIRECVRLVARSLPGAHVSVTLNHHRPGASSRTGRVAVRADQGDRVFANLAGKLDAGAQGVQTQVTFDLASLDGYAELILSRWPDVRITPMLMPVLSARAAVRLSRRLAIPLPAALMHRLELFGADAGWEHFAAFARAIAASPLYHGLAVMTPIDPDPGFARDLRVVLRSASAGWSAGNVGNAGKVGNVGNAGNVGNVGSV
jgi:5,10-methylenetetrahydrofolate reductase